MFATFFLVAFIYTALKVLKQTLSISQGAKVIPFLKLYAVLPGAFLFVWLLAKLYDVTTREKVFYIVVSIFISVVALFAFVLYPNEEAIKLTAFTLRIKAQLPDHIANGLGGLLLMIEYWHISLMYVTSELWGAIVLTTLCWGFVNDITTLKESTRFYSLFSFSGNLSGITVGYLFISLKDLSSFKIPGTDTADMAKIFSFVMPITIAAMILVLVLFKYLSVVNRERIEAKEREEKKVTKHKLSISESFAYLFKFKYLGYLALIVLCYNAATNLFQTIWYYQQETTFIGDKAQLMFYNGKITLYAAILSTIIDFVITGNVIRRLGWTTAALATPILFSFLGIFFFTSTILTGLGADLNYIWLLVGLNPMYALVNLGAIQEVSTRALKYTVFDASKEIAYIPINPESKKKGKAAIDGVGSRFSKSTSSLLVQILLILASSSIYEANIGDITIPVIMIIIMLIALWLFSVYKLSKYITKEEIKEYSKTKTS